MPDLCGHALQAAKVGLHHGGDAAYYDGIHDEITLPSKANFHSPAAYASTLFHELVHATGAAHRLDRNLNGRFGGAHEPEQPSGRNRSQQLTTPGFKSSKDNTGGACTKTGRKEIRQELSDSGRFPAVIG